MMRSYSRNNIAPKDTYNRPISDLRVSLLDQCNFRCTYCMPERKFHSEYQFLKKQQRLSHEEIFRIVKIAVELGVTKVRLTGGEPLLDKNISKLINLISQVNGVEDLALTTNGVLLKKHANEMMKAGLDRITVSLDSIDEAIFNKMNGNKASVRDVLDGIEAAEKAGFDKIKINTVIQRGVNDDYIISLLDHFRGTGHIVRLIEFMDVGNQNDWKLNNVVTAKEMLEIIEKCWEVIPLEKTYVGEVAKRYSYKDGKGEIGFITSISEPFCSNCGRVRLSADGMLYTCLFATVGTDLRKLLRSDASDHEIKNVIARRWLERTDRYSETRNNHTSHITEKKIEMYRMGG